MHCWIRLTRLHFSAPVPTLGSHVLLLMTQGQAQGWDRSQKQAWSYCQHLVDSQHLADSRLLQNTFQEAHALTATAERLDVKDLSLPDLSHVLPCGCAVQCMLSLICPRESSQLAACNGVT